MCVRCSALQRDLHLLLPATRPPADRRGPLCTPLCLMFVQFLPASASSATKSEPSAGVKIPHVAINRATFLPRSLYWRMRSAMQASILTDRAGLLTYLYYSVKPICSSGPCCCGAQSLWISADGAGWCFEPRQQPVCFSNTQPSRRWRRPCRTGRQQCRTARQLADCPFCPVLGL